jgi:hypothetical protein
MHYEQPDGIVVMFEGFVMNQPMSIFCARWISHSSFAARGALHKAQAKIVPQLE